MFFTVFPFCLHISWAVGMLQPNMTITRLRSLLKISLYFGTRYGLNIYLNVDNPQQNQFSNFPKISTLMLYRTAL